MVTESEKAYQRRHLEMVRTLAPRLNECLPNIEPDDIEGLIILTGSLVMYASAIFRGIGSGADRGAFLGLAVDSFDAGMKVLVPPEGDQSEHFRPVEAEPEPVAHDWAWAVAQMRAGKTVSRLGPDHSLRANESGVIIDVGGSGEEAPIDLDDCEATDWQVAA